MNQATPRMRYFAGRLIAHEAVRDPSRTPLRPGIMPVIERMVPHLAMLMGNTGSRALIARALVISSRETRWLAEVKVGANATLDGWDAAAPASGPESDAAGERLLATLLGLLVSFIGEILTLRLIREIWPKLPLHESFTQGQDHEPTQ